MFMTPRGLKIRIDVPLGFTLLARLWEKDARTDAVRVLTTAEHLERLPSLVGFLGGMVGLMFGSAWWHMAATLVAGRVLGTLITMFFAGAFVVPGLHQVVRWWSAIARYGALTIAIAAALWVLRGWEYGAAWIGASLAGPVISMFSIEVLRMKFYFKTVGHALTQSEINFFNAYRLHAHELDLTLSIEVEEDEIRDGGWRRCLEDYAAKCPAAAFRSE